MKLLKLTICILVCHSYDQTLIRLNQPPYEEYREKSTHINLLTDTYFKSQAPGLQYAVFYARKKDEDPTDSEGKVVINGNKPLPPESGKGAVEKGKNFILSTPVSNNDPENEKTVHAEYNIIDNSGIADITGSGSGTKFYLYSFFSPCCSISARWLDDKDRNGLPKYVDTSSTTDVKYCAFFSCAAKIRGLMVSNNLPLTIGFSKVFGVRIPGERNTVFGDAEYKFYLGMITIVSSNKAILVWMRDANQDQDWFQLQLYVCLSKVDGIEKYFMKDVQYPVRKFVNLVTWHCFKKQIGEDEMTMFKEPCFREPKNKDEVSGVFELLSPNAYSNLQTAVGKCYNEIERAGRQTLGPALNTGNKDILIPSSLYNDYIGYYYQPKNKGEFYDFFEMDKKKV